MVSQNNSLPDQWSSKWAFILAATGAAVGLGNIWRFPYMAGLYGGSAFFLIYLLCVVLMGLPIMVAEILIGRAARQNPVNALSSLAQQNGHSRHWSLLGWWGALGLLLTLSFYSVVSGWSIAYFFQSISGHLETLNPSQIHKLWSAFLSNPWRLLAWHTVFMVLTMTVIARGVQQGLERATRFMMPALYIILFALVMYAATQGDFMAAFHFLFDFNLSKINASVVIAAMGHAFFTLALGAGAMLMYGAYLPKRVNIINAVCIVASLDVLVAILSGLAIFPIVFAHHLSEQSGPGLMFQSLPIAFAQMPFGAVIGSLFFLLLLFAAWTSSLNIAEPIIVIAMQRLGLRRSHAAWLVGFLAWGLGIGSALSFNIWKHVTLNGSTLFDVATNLPTNIILPLGGLGFAVFAGYVIKKNVSREALANTSIIGYTVWRTLIRYLAPIGILIIFISSL